MFFFFLFTFECNVPLRVVKVSKAERWRKDEEARRKWEERKREKTNMTEESS